MENQRNYPTYVTCLWLNNEYTSYMHWRLRAKATLDKNNNDKFESKYMLADEMKETLEAATPDEYTKPSVYCDLLRYALEEVDWVEVAEDFLSEFDE